MPSVRRYGRFYVIQKFTGHDMNLSTLTLEERERLAYAEGYTQTAALFAELDDMRYLIARYESALEAIAEGGANGTMTAKQCAGAAREVLQ